MSGALPAGARASDRPLAGVGFMVLASLCFAVMNAVASRLGARGVPWSVTAFARASVGLLAALAIARARGASLAVRDRRTMWTRAVAGTAGMLCTFYSLTRLPLADATALLNTTPLFTAGLAALTLREPPGRVVLGALAAALVAVGLIERPALAVGNVGGLVALCAGAATALAMVSLRRLSNESTEGVVVQFSAFATGVLATLLLANLARTGRAPLAPSAGVLLGLLGVGLLATAGQFAMTRAYALDRAARVGAVGWSQVLFSLAIDVAVLRRAPPALTVLGIALLAGAGLVLVWDAGREQRARAAQPALAR